MFVRVLLVSTYINYIDMFSTFAEDKRLSAPETFLS